MQHNGWDHALKVTADGTGLVGHAGTVLLRKAADQAGLTGQLSAALRKAGASPAFDRGIVLVLLAAAIALGATSMSDIALLAHLAPVLGDAPSGPTVRRALDLAGTPAMLDRIARARAKARAKHVRLLGMSDDIPVIVEFGCRECHRQFGFSVIGAYILLNMPDLEGISFQRLTKDNSCPCRAVATW
jgi:hypothetical protein